MQQKNRELKEEMAEKDGQIKVLTTNLSNSEKQQTHLNEEVKMV